MDLENNARMIKSKRYPNIECRYFQTSTSRIYVTTVNPYDTVGNYDEDTEDNQRKMSNDKMSDILNNVIKSPYAETFNNIDHDISHGYRLNTDDLTKEAYSDNEALSYNLSTRPFDAPGAVPCSRSVPKTSTSYAQQVEFQGHNQNVRYRLSLKDMFTTPAESQIPRAEKATNCRPLHEMYNEEFVYHIMQRNARMKNIVRKIVIERQREKQKEAWNNYINELKNKHQYCSREPARISYGDYYDITQDVLDHLYGNGWNQRPKSSKCDLDNMPYQTPKQYYENDPYCCHTSSLGRHIVLNRQRGLKDDADLPEHMKKYYRSGTIIVDKYPNKSKQRFPEYLYKRDFFNYKKRTVHENIVVGVQTDPDLLENIERIPFSGATKATSYDNITKETINNVSNDSEVRVSRLSSNVTMQNETTLSQTERDKKTNPLRSIEKKLDNLIESFAAFVKETRAKNRLKSLINKSVSACLSTDKAKQGTTSNLSEPNKRISELSTAQKTDQVLYATMLAQKNNVVSENSTNTQGPKDVSKRNIDRILQEEIEKSENIKKDIEDLLHSRFYNQCSVEISFDIPTKDMSTEVAKDVPTLCTVDTGSTHSYRQSEKELNVEESSSPARSTSIGDRQMTIAVNTDPMGLLGLLRVSTETIMQFLSYVPQLNYQWYLPIHPAPLPQRPHAAPYVCNICGASFDQPSQLSDHIQQHNLGRTRDCCICRHVLDMQRDRSFLFQCKYCGQRFVRAYCCELHQQTCAKRLGKEHDVNPNLLLLR